MKSIMMEDIESGNFGGLVVDIRKEEDFRSGSMEGAVSLPVEQITEKLFMLPQDRQICVLGYTEKSALPTVELLDRAGFDAAMVKGAFPAWLSSCLEKSYPDEESLHRRTREIERSIIKKFRKPIWRQFTRGIQEYQLIREGDHIACCISGGKDSMLMAKLLQELQRHGQAHFDLTFLEMDPGYREENRKIIRNNARILGIPLTTFENDIFDIVAGVEKNPCYLCARMRRGFLYDRAKSLGCNKIALGHHFDDVIETILMGMLYGGKVETMMPKLHSQHFEGMELIRPMYLIKEQAVKEWRDYNHLHFIQCACRFTENLASGDHQTSKRDEMKELIAGFRQKSDVIEANIFKSVQNINLRTVIGYHKNDMKYNFLDDYDDRNEQ